MKVNFTVFCASSILHGSPTPHPPPPVYIRKTISWARLIFQRLHTMGDKFSRRALTFVGARKKKKKEK